MKEGRLLTFDVQVGSGFCCGLAEIGGFQKKLVELSNKDLWQASEDYDVVNETQFPPKEKDKAFFATTTAAQRGAAKKLKTMGFKKLGSWTRDTGVKLTMWGWFPKRSKRKGRK